MMKKINNITYNMCSCLTLCLPFFLSGCGKISANFLEPKAAPAPLAKSASLSAITADTALNILQNSLLESILLLVAVIMYMRYRVLVKKNNRLDELNNKKYKNKNFIDYSGSFDYANWHFDEEEHKKQ